MTTSSATDDVDKLWDWAARQLERVYIPPAPSAYTLEKLKAMLPEREAQESLQHWLKRCQAKLTEAGEWKKWQRIVCPPFDLMVFDSGRDKKPQAKTRQYRAVKLAQIVRLAADTALEEYPLPEPGTALESENGVFRLFLNALPDNKIQVKLQVRGADIEDYARERLGIVAVDDDRLVADIPLNDFAGGETEIADTRDNRKALLAMIIVLIQAEDA
jgi:hypothetical protein